MAGRACSADRFRISLLRSVFLLPAVASAVSPPLVAQDSPAAERPPYKGVWEPVNFPAALVLNDVFFVSPDLGWVTGSQYGNRAGGVILHTRDGGESWTIQLGDPESSESAFERPFFLDERRGWAVQCSAPWECKLLHTRDGDLWEQTGSIEPQWGLRDYVFHSDAEGLFIDANNNIGRILRTTDGGRTWNPVYACRAKLEVEGLVRDVDCNLKAMHFPTSRVGYAVGGANGAPRTIFVARTADGGATWSLHTIRDVGGDLEVNFDQSLFFSDEQTGFVHLSDGRLYRTTDGGETWTGLVATPGHRIRFAGDVGWSFRDYRNLSYTTDGGRRWTSREFPFPTPVSAFSLPAPWRGYVVGEHGMIYRYSVVPEAAPVAERSIPAPVMAVPPEAPTGG